MVVAGLWQQQAPAAPSAGRLPPLDHRPDLAEGPRSQGVGTSDEVGARTHLCVRLGMYIM